MGKKNNYIIIGTAPNQDELIEGKHFYEYLVELSKKYTIVGMNQVVMDDNIRPYLDIIITIDFHTYVYLEYYPELQHKMYVDRTVKKAIDKKNILQDITNIFSVDKEIHLVNNSKLFLNKYAPTCLHSAINLCIVKSLENEIAIEEDIISKTNIFLWGVQLSENWNHYDSFRYAHQITKDSKTITNMRESVYSFKKYCNLSTLNKNTSLDLKYTSLVKLLNY